MAAPKFISEFFAWRWMPCVLLTSGSLLYVGLAMLLVPSGFDANGSDSTAALRSGQTPSFGSSLFGSSSDKARPATVEPTVAAASPAAPTPAQSPAPGGVLRRGFSPPLERPEPPPPPPPPNAVPPPNLPAAAVAPPPMNPPPPPPQADEAPAADDG